MKIAIDLNDVIRDYSNNFVKYYIEGYDHEFDLSDFEFWSHDISNVFPFKSQQSYYNFVYNDYAFELYGKCDVCTRKLETELNDWTEKIIKDLDIDEEIEIMFVSPKEYGLSIGNTYFFLSKIGTKIREVYFPIDSSTIWDKCDVLITANPDLMEIKPEGKISVKIKTEYNKENNANFAFKDFSTFLTNNENIELLINEFNKQKKQE
jgi:hypothetical protein